MAPMFTPMRFVLLCTIDPSLSNNVCENAEAEKYARIHATATANNFFMKKLLRRLFDLSDSGPVLWRSSHAVIYGNRKGEIPHRNKHLTRAKQRNSPSKTKCFNGLVYLVLHAAEASLEIVGKRTCFGL
jgi:hypothetical protein